MNRLAASGNMVLNNTTSVIKGGFYRPETVLDTIATIARAQPVEDGVIDITGKDVSGRLGIKNNTVITGAVVDKTGETGTAAVCRLLLLPYGLYTFRHAIPTDKLHLQQDLNLPFDDAKSFLSGPSSIGLASPAKQTLSNLQTLTGEFAWENTTLRTSEFDWESTTFRDSYGRKDPADAVADSISVGDYHDCKQLVEGISKKRTETFEILSKQGNQSKMDVDVSKPGPLPSRKVKGKTVNKVSVAAGILAVLGVVAGLSWLTDYVLHPPAPEVAVAPVLQGAPNSASAPAPKKEPTGRAPFVLPSGASQNVVPPANQPSSTPSEPEQEQEEGGSVQPPAPVSSQAVAAPTSDKLGDAEITRCMDAVRAAPADAKARRELAQAYLLKGDVNTSVEQFYTVMKLRKVEPSEIIAYADNLTVFGSKDISRQFLSNILRSDPSQKEIRDRLAEMR